MAGNLVWLKYRVQNGAGKTTLEKLAEARFPGQEIQKSLSICPKLFLKERKSIGNLTCKKENSRWEMVLSFPLTLFS